MHTHTLSVTVIIIGKGIVTGVQILDKAVCISFLANALRKSMNSSVLLPVIYKL